jgi:hypothetical protein
VEPVPDPLLRKSGSAENRNRTSESEARNCSSRRNLGHAISYAVRCVSKEKSIGLFVHPLTVVR